ncbi:hypothetical protein [Pontibacter chitinilyticus]|uniref:hypothetical protein n=1 Tax=Pontibacter chitinilyticus TaxID=2674989 RepID=UPI00321BC933
MVRKKDAFAQALHCLLILPLLLAAAPAFAQISHTTEEQQRKEQKQFLKEADKTESVYKETHLNTAVYTFKKGEAARKRAKAKGNNTALNDKGEPLTRWKLFQKKGKRLKKKRSN